MVSKGWPASWLTGMLMVGHGGSSAGSYLTDPTYPIPSHCASIVVTSTVRVNYIKTAKSVHPAISILKALSQ